MSASSLRSSAPRMLPVLMLLAANLVSLAVASLVISHGVSFVQDYLVGGERLTLEEPMMQPHARVTVLHLTILAGGFAAGFFGSPAWALVIMVALKVGVDRRAHLAEHAPKGESGS